MRRRLATAILLAAAAVGLLLLGMRDTLAPHTPAPTVVTHTQ
jgi:hypothetical protein